MPRLESDVPQLNAIRLARVSRSYPDKHCVDVVFLDDGGFAAGVPVLTTSASQNHGLAYLPAVSEPSDTNGRWSLQLTGNDDVLCAVAFASGVPLVLGFFFPAGEHMAVATNELLDKHISGFIRSIKPNGDYLSQRPAPKNHYFTMLDDKVEINFQPENFYIRLTQDGILIEVDTSKIEVKREEILIESAGARIRLAEGKVELN